MKIGLSQLLVIGVGVLVFCGIVAVRMRQEGAPDAAFTKEAARVHAVTKSVAQRAANLPHYELAPAESQRSNSAVAEPPSFSPEVSAAMSSSGPEIPMSLVLDDVPDSGGHRVVLHSRSSEPLLVTLTLANRKARDKFTTELTVPAYGTTEIDGVAADQGDWFVLASSGYRDAVVYYQ